MKDITKAQAEASRPLVSPRIAVEYCLERLFADRRRLMGDEVASSLTYEELIGALLLAKDVFDKVDGKE